MISNPEMQFSTSVASGEAFHRTPGRLQPSEFPWSMKVLLESGASHSPRDRGWEAVLCRGLPRGVRSRQSQAGCAVQGLPPSSLDPQCALQEAANVVSADLSARICPGLTLKPLSDIFHTLIVVSCPRESSEVPTS